MAFSLAPDSVQPQAAKWNLPAFSLAPDTTPASNPVAAQYKADAATEASPVASAPMDIHASPLGQAFKSIGTGKIAPVVTAPAPSSTAQPSFNDFINQGNAALFPQATNSGKGLLDTFMPKATSYLQGSAQKLTDYANQTESDRAANEAMGSQGGVDSSIQTFLGKVAKGLSATDTSLAGATQALTPSSDLSIVGRAAKVAGAIGTMTPAGQAITQVLSQPEYLNSAPVKEAFTLSSGLTDKIKNSGLVQGLPPTIKTNVQDGLDFIGQVLPYIALHELVTGFSGTRGAINSIGYEKMPSSPGTEVFTPRDWLAKVKDLTQQLKDDPAQFIKDKTGFDINSKSVDQAPQEAPTTSGTKIVSTETGNEMTPPEAPFTLAPDAPTEPRTNLASPSPSETATPAVSENTTVPELFNSIKQKAMEAGFQDVTSRDTPVIDRINNQNSPTGVVPGSNELQVHVPTLESDITGLMNGDKLEVNGKVFQQKPGESISSVTNRYLDEIIKYEKTLQKNTTVGQATEIEKGNGANVNKAVDEQTTKIIKEPIDKVKSSKIGKSIEAKAVESKLTKGFQGTAGYESINLKDQAERATKLVNESHDEARAIIRGQAPLPEGLKGTALITAMEEHIKAHPNPVAAYELANSPLVTGTSHAAQEMRLAAERDPDSATAKFDAIKKAREATAEKITSKKQSEEVKSLDKLTRKENLTKEEMSWDNFISDITC